jgi:hypothetical protein
MIELAKKLKDRSAAARAAAEAVKSGDLSKLDLIETAPIMVDQISRDLISQYLVQFGVANNTSAELKLMTDKVDSLQGQLSALEGFEKLPGMSALAKLLASDVKLLLKLTRNLGREAEAQTAYLTQTKKIVQDDKGLISAATQTADACQMFVLLVSLFKEKDPDSKFKCLAACQLMRENIVAIRVNMLKIGGSPEISKRIDTLCTQVVEIIDKIRTAAEADPTPAVPAAEQPKKATQTGGLGLIVQKRNAAEVVTKRRRALEEAQEEVKRLNRAASRRR